MKTTFKRGMLAPVSLAGTGFADTLILKDGTQVTVLKFRIAKAAKDAVLGAAATKKKKQ